MRVIPCNWATKKWATIVASWWNHLMDSGVWDVKLRTNLYMFTVPYVDWNWTCKFIYLYIYIYLHYVICIHISWFICISFTYYTFFRCIKSICGHCVLLQMECAVFIEHWNMQQKTGLRSCSNSGICKPEIEHLRDDPWTYHISTTDAPRVA